ncbi:MAG: ComEC/Rec2 family competence protein, partial [Caulobacteraceae bacterium]
MLPKAGGAALITPLRRWPSMAVVGSWLRGEAAGQEGRLALWAPVAFGVGAASYLALKFEPPLWIPALLFAILGSLAVAARLYARSKVAVGLAALLALAAAGLFVAKLHSDRLAAPIAPANLGMVSVDGFVVDIATPSERGERLLIAPVRISRLVPAMTPHLIRIVLATPGGPEAAPSPGQAIRLTTLLDPPPGPAAPGAYDFARDAWFEGIGGVGLAMEAPQLVSLAPPPWRLRLEMGINSIRWSVAKQLAADIHAVMGPEDGGAAGLAAAVTTSHQDWLAKQDRDDLRASGLAHMLAIAGLHTAALSGFAFFAFRLAIAAWPWLALRVPGKKVAAAAALVVVGLYLVLSGAHPPARRAAITASVAFVAILLDRRAVSLHSLALAALIVLALEPEVVVQPGFEMSFCATASLVVLAELWPRRRRATGLPWPIALIQRLRDWTIAMFMVSLVAGAATGPFAIQHFNRVANYGVFANLTADFVASVVLMPMLALCLVLEALGLGHGVGSPVLFAAGWAARAVVWLGHLFAAAPGSGLTMPSAPEAALIVSYAGIVFACLWRGRLRWIGVPMAAAVAVWPRP